MQRDYAPKGVKFFYIYKALAHPDKDGFVSPVTLKERLAHIQEAKKRLGTRFEWICDTMKNDVKHALGSAPNSEFIINPKGKIVRKRFWSNPSQTRKDLEELVGPIEKRTKVSDLDLPKQPPKRKPATGVVQRVELPGRMMALKTEPKLTKTKEPFYVKLRAEADRGVLRNGEGTLYLGFYLDPIYKVHWNNEAGRVRFELKAPKGITLSKTKGESQKVKVPADLDPREFLIDIEGAKPGQVIVVTVHYIACDDAETFCKPVTQQYKLYITRDPDGGSRMSSFRGRRRGGR